MEEFFGQCLDVYCKLTKKPSTIFKRVTTPFIDESLDWDCVNNPVMEECGELSANCSKIIMKVLYGARMCRPDLIRACTALASNVTKWTKSDDIKLKRMMDYIFCTKHYRLINWVGDVLKDWHLNMYVDSDFASDTKSMKSTSGLCLKIESEQTCFFLSWVSNKQTAVSLSSTEAEIVAACSGMSKFGIPTLNCFEYIKGSRIQLYMMEDNQASQRIMEVGRSDKMSYLKRTHKVDLRWLHERIIAKDFKIIYINTNYQCADPMTKAITCKATWDRSMVNLNLFDLNANQIWKSNPLKKSMIEQKQVTNAGLKQQSKAPIITSIKQDGSVMSVPASYLDNKSIFGNLPPIPDFPILEAELTPRTKEYRSHGARSAIENDKRVFCHFVKCGKVNKSGRIGDYCSEKCMQHDLHHKACFVKKTSR